MRTKWKDLGHNIAGFPCASLFEKHAYLPTPVELALIGYNGEIWEKGDGTWKGVKIGTFGDKQFTISTLEDLKAAIEELKVPLDPKVQAYIGSNRK